MADAARHEAAALLERNRVLEEELEAARKARPLGATAAAAIDAASVDPESAGAGRKIVRQGAVGGMTAEEKAAMQAARHGRVEELEELLQQVHVNSANEAGNTLLIVAAQNNQRAVCKSLHDRGADLNSINRQVSSHFLD